MMAYIVTEGDFDRDVLQAVLPRELKEGVGIVSGQGNHISLARSLVMRRHVPLALVLDADCVSAKLIAERRQDVEELLRMAAGKTPVKAVFFVPTIEAIFFEDPALLSGLLGYQLSQEILDRAKFEPKQALRQALQCSNHIDNTRHLLTALTGENIKTLQQKSNPLQGLMSFLRDMRLEQKVA
ncbi:MAG: hypothetical protein ACKN9T_00775 [Candidatus Methylumidiphilus sp.]